MPERLHLELEIDPTEPIAGTLTESDGGERPFAGWLDLLAALDAAYVAARGEDAAGSGYERSDA